LSAPDAFSFPDERPDEAPPVVALQPADDAGAWSAPRIPAAAPDDDPATISVERILIERPDVLRGFYEAFHGAGNDRDSTAWAKRVGGDTPEAYARYWYDHHGKYEGYNQGPTTAQDNVSLTRILEERPDVLRAFYEEYYGPGNDRDSNAWAKRVGEATPEAYAKYWYETRGRWEGYAQSEKAAAEATDVRRLLVERPDVMRAFYEEYYGPNNDRKSDAWTERVGGATPEDYAKYWYETHGWREGYTQRPSAEAAPPELDPLAPVGEDPPADLGDGADSIVLEAEPETSSAIGIVGGASAADPSEWGG